MKTSSSTSLKFSCLSGATGPITFVLFSDTTCTTSSQTVSSSITSGGDCNAVGQYFVYGSCAAGVFPPAIRGGAIVLDPVTNDPLATCDEFAASSTPRIFVPNASSCVENATFFIDDQDCSLNLCQGVTVASTVLLGSASSACAAFNWAGVFKLALAGVNFACTGQPEPAHRYVCPITIFLPPGHTVSCTNETACALSPGYSPSLCSPDVCQLQTNTDVFSMTAVNVASTLDGVPQSTNVCTNPVCSGATSATSYSYLMPDTGINTVFEISTCSASGAPGGGGGSGDQLKCPDAPAGDAEFSGTLTCSNIRDCPDVTPALGPAVRLRR